MKDAYAQVVDMLLAQEPDPQALRAWASGRFHLPESETEAALYRVIRDLNARLAPPITKIEMLLADTCNMACSYCFEGKVLSRRSHGSKLMDDDTIVRSITLLFDYSGTARDLAVTYFGGEPTLNFPAIRTATDLIKRKERETGKTVELHMTTNGYLVTSPMAEYFAANGIRVLLSIDGLKDTHDANRVDKHGRGTYETVIETLKLLKRHQPWIGVKMTVTPEAAPKLCRDVMGLYDLGVNQFLIGHATGGTWNEGALKTFCDQMLLLRDWYKMNRLDDLRIDDFDDDETTKSGAVFGCSAARSTISVACNGEISGCSKILTLEPDRVVGKLGDVWLGLYGLSERIEQVSCAQLKANCQIDGIAQSYQGGCFATNFEERGDLYKPSLFEHRLSQMRKLHAV